MNCKGQISYDSSMSNRRPEIQNILIVLGAAVITAAIIAAFFVLNFGASGRYNLDAVLIKPSMLKQLDYNDNNPRISHSDRYVFDKILWVDTDYSSRQVGAATYEKIYALLKADKSVMDPDIEKLFFSIGAPKLSIWVRTESPSQWQRDAKVFQEIEFQKDFYRVSLHEESSEVAFAYFPHPDILQTVQKLLQE